MDTSALERNIKSLETSLDSFELWLSVMTLLVVAGLIVEYWHEIPEELEKLREARKWLWKPVCVIFGAILITIGVAGELAVQFLASAKETQLRQANDAVFVGLNAEAAKARKDVETAEARIAEARRAAAEAQSSAEAERLERMRLQAIVAPRSLSLDEQRQIAEVCRRFAGHRAIVSSYGLDGEGAAIGGQLIALLRLALGNDNVLDSRASSVVTGGFQFGIHLRGPDSERDFIRALSDSLSSLGRLHTFINQPIPAIGSGMRGGGQTFPAGTPFVDIMVGIKPVPLIPPR